MSRPTSTAAFKSGRGQKKRSWHICDKNTFELGKRPQSFDVRLLQEIKIWNFVELSDYKCILLICEK
jgi:hypothetical protein